MRLIDANDKYYPVLRGVASTLDLFASGYRGRKLYKNVILKRSALEAFQRDRDALRADWIVVGNDLLNAINEVGRDVQKKST